MKLISYKSDGLGGFFGVSNSLKLGTTKRVTYNKLHIVLFLIIFSGLASPTSSITNLLSLIIALQRSNEAYKNIKPRTYRKLNLTQTALCLSNLVNFIIISKLLFWMYCLLPISLLSQLGKTMERCIHKYLYNYETLKALITFSNTNTNTNSLLSIKHYNNVYSHKYTINIQ